MATEQQPNSLYYLLGAQPSTPLNIIQRNYNSLAAVWRTLSSDSAIEHLRLIENAWSILSNSRTKAEYDSSINGSGGVAASGAPGVVSESPRSQDVAFSATQQSGRDASQYVAPHLRSVHPTPDYPVQDSGGAVGSGVFPHLRNPAPTPAQPQQGNTASNLRPHFQNTTAPPSQLPRTGGNGPLILPNIQNNTGCDSSPVRQQGGPIPLGQIVQVSQSSRPRIDTTPSTPPPRHQNDTSSSNQIAAARHLGHSTSNSEHQRLIRLMEESKPFPGETDWQRQQRGLYEHFKKLQTKLDSLHQVR